MPEIDFYKTLGVGRNASAEEIRKAYKKLARKYHPDVRPGDKDAADQFKKVQQAYSVLGDAEKRVQFDRFGHASNGGHSGPYRTAWASGPDGTHAVDLSDLFNQVFGEGMRGGPGAGFERGPFHGGGGGARGPRAETFGHGEPFGGAQKGDDIAFEVTVPFQVAAEGGSHGLQIRRGDQTERITVKIPAGLDDEGVIRLAGQGHPGASGGQAGDLLLTVHVSPHPYFHREGNNLLIDVPITPSEGALGTKVEVPTLSEGRVTVTVPPGTSSGTKLRLRGKGVVNPKTKERGDQFVVVKIVLPRETSDAAKKLYQELAEIEPAAPRSELW